MTNLGLKNNNAGNLRDPKTGNFQVFNDMSQGYKALIDDLEYKKAGKSSHIQPGGSILDLATVWAPASDNNKPQDWANNVAKTVGKNITDSWSDVPTDQLAKGIQVAEGTSTPSTVQKTPQVSENSSSQLVQKWKAKYPTQYNDLSDSKLEKMILKKYPQYADLASPETKKQISQDSLTHTNNKGAVGKSENGLIDLVPGAKTLGESLGTNLGYGYEKLKGLVGGQDNSKYYDMSQPSIKDTAIAGAKVGGDIATVIGAGELGTGLVNLMKGSSILSNPTYAQIVEREIPGFAKRTATEQFDALSQLGNKTGTEKTIFDKLTKEIMPAYIKENPSLYSFLEKSPSIAKGLGLAKKAGSFILRSGIDIAGIKELNYLSSLFK